MAVLSPSSLSAALGALAEHPDATVLAGGTDLMVEINGGHRRPAEVIVTLDRVAELRRWSIDDSHVTIGAGVTYFELTHGELAPELPALAEASRTVGSPQIRRTGTIGGNLGTCSPAGDTLPVLAALGATVHLASAAGERSLPVAEFMVGVKRNALLPGELITAIEIPRRNGWQGYAKVGVRNAMVISVASACLSVDLPTQHVALALGSVGPTVIRCAQAESFASSGLDWSDPPVTPEFAQEFGRLAAAASRPIDDHRSTAAYRRHAVGVLAGRLLQRAFAAPDTEETKR